MVWRMSLSDKDKADIRRADAEADGIYIDRGVINPDESRARLNDEEGGVYSGALAGPAPEVPDDEGGDDLLSEDGWNEGDHPRDADGKFGSRGGSSPGKLQDPFSHEVKASSWGEAVGKLKSLRSGYVEGILEHPELGKIDVPWGNPGTGKSDGFGLSKLLEMHPDVVEDLPALIKGMAITSRSKNRVNLESADHRAGVRLDWNGESHHWLITAFRKDG